MPSIGAVTRLAEGTSAAAGQRAATVQPRTCASSASLRTVSSCGSSFRGPTRRSSRCRQGPPSKAARTRKCRLRQRARLRLIQPPLFQPSHCPPSGGNNRISQLHCSRSGYNTLELQVSKARRLGPVGLSRSMSGSSSRNKQVHMNISRRAFSNLLVCSPVLLKRRAEAHSLNDYTAPECLSNELLRRAEMAIRAPNVSLGEIEKCIDRSAHLKGVKTPTVKWFGSVHCALESIYATSPIEIIFDLPAATFWTEIHEAFRDPQTLADAEFVHDVGLKARETCETAFIADVFGSHVPFLNAIYDRATTSRELLRLMDLKLNHCIDNILTDHALRAAWSIQEVVLAKHKGFGVSSEPVKRSLSAFRAWECGLRASWEFSGELLCVPRIAGAHA